MHPRRWFFVFLALCLMLGTRVHAQFSFLGGGDSHLTATLVADTSAVEAGKPFTVGVRMVIEPEWYTYWRFVGDIGTPTSVEWELPPGFKAGELQWPTPVRHEGAGGYVSYAYENETLLMAEITPPATLPAGPITLRAKIKWQVCNPKTCIPGDAAVSLELPAGKAAPDNAQLFATFRAQLPRDGATPFAVAWDRSKANEFSLKITGLAKDVSAEFFPLPAKGIKPGHPKTSPIAEDGTRTITFPIEEGGAPNLAWRGVLATVKAGGVREGWALVADAGAASASEAAPTAKGPAAPKQEGLLLMLGIAFLGGLIMNVMPCVLPVIALKIFGFVHQAGQSPQRVFRLGLAFTAGVFAFFFGLAVIVARLGTSFQWGYQFQNAYLLVGMITLVFVFGLNLLGVFEITLASGAASKLSELSGREGYGGAFLHGLFTTLLGTSCTAPFLGASLGFAVTQSAPVIFLIFLAIATGMSLPYFLLTARPAWLRYVPKPGMWMERAKQVMGFAMLGLAAWLFGILAYRGAPAIIGTSWFLVVVGMAAWLFGLNGSWLTRIGALVLPVWGYFAFVHGQLTPPPVKPAESIEKKINDARAANLPVFIDFTAEWCVNCKFFEKTVLHADAVQAKLQEKKVVFVIADWTNTEDPEVTRLLKSFNRVGVPLYVLYLPGVETPIVTDTLTQSSLLAELDRIKN
jgi:thiol:disulfide interchange protein DsbD